MNQYPSLKAIAENKVDGVQKATYFKVRPDLLEFEPGFNLREESDSLQAHLDAMYVAMKAGAYFPPIDVSVIDGRIIVRDGHCRTRTALRLLNEGEPIMLEARQIRGNDADCVFHMLQSAQGKQLTPLEQGRGFLRLIRMGNTVQGIAERTGLSRTSIDNGLILAEAPSSLQDLVSSGKVSAHVAIDAIRQHGSKAEGVLRAALDRVSATGKTKVTAKAVSTRIPAKVVTAFVGRLRAEVAGFDTLHLMADDTPVMVNAGTMKMLLTHAPSLPITS